MITISLENYKHVAFYPCGRLIMSAAMPFTSADTLLDRELVMQDYSHSKMYEMQKLGR